MCVYVYIYIYIYIYIGLTRAPCATLTEVAAHLIG